VAGLAGPEGAVVVAGDAVEVVRVRDVPERHGNAGLLHLRDSPERVLGENAVEAGEAGLPERVGDRLFVHHVADRAAAIVDSRVDVLGAEEALEAVVATGLRSEE